MVTAMRMQPSQKCERSMKAQRNSDEGVALRGLTPY